MTVTPDQGRPGPTRYVPGLRIFKLGDRPGSGDSGHELTDLDPDVVRVEVTQVCSGCSQYRITLNNLVSRLPNDPPEERGHREERGASADDVFPAFRYNDLSTIGFGTRLRIDMGYESEPHPIDEEPSGRVWIPLVAGPVVDLRFVFNPGQGAQLVIHGEDDLRTLKNRNPTRVQYKDRSEKDIVSDVLSRSGLPLPLAGAAVAWPAPLENGQDLAESHDDGQSYLEYLMKLGDRFDLEVFVEFADPDDAGSALEFHCEPSRSRLAPSADDEDSVLVEQGGSLVELLPLCTAADQYTRVTVKGRHRLRGRATRVSQDAEAAVVDDELHDDGGGGTLTSGPAVRTRYFGDNPHVEHDIPNVDDERARLIAEAILRRKARDFMRVEGRAIGLPRIRAGKHVRIRGMQPPLDGWYYVVKAIHTHGAEGFRTWFSARRPGMPLPPYGSAGRT